MGAGSDSTLVNKIAKNNLSNKTFAQCGPGSRGADKTLTTDHFQVTHYAGPIIYHCKDFIEKNKDTLYDHVVHLLHNSSNSLLQSLYPKAGGSHKIQTTVVSRFSNNISQLLKVIKNTQPRFIRCIKTNNELLPDKIEQASVLRQLKYAGVLAALQMRRSGFPNRMTYQELATRCRSLVKGFSFNANHDRKYWRDLVESMLSMEGVASSVSMKEVAFGQTRLFMRANVLHRLDCLVQESITESVIAAQTAVRCNFSRKKYARLRSSTISLQSLFRGRKTRRQHREMLQRVAANRALSLGKVRLEKAETKLKQLRQNASGLHKGPTAQVKYCNTQKVVDVTTMAGKTISMLKQSLEEGRVDEALQKQVEDSLEAVSFQVDSAKRKEAEFKQKLKAAAEDAKGLEAEFTSCEEEAAKVTKLGTKLYEKRADSAGKVKQAIVDFKTAFHALDSLLDVQDTLAKVQDEVDRHALSVQSIIQKQQETEQTSARLRSEIEVARSDFFAQSAAFSGFNHLQELGISYSKVQRALDEAQRVLHGEEMEADSANECIGRVVETLKEYEALGRSAVEAQTELRRHKEEAETVVAEGKFTVLRLEQQYDSLSGASAAIQQSFQDINALLREDKAVPQEQSKLSDMLTAAQKIQRRNTELREGLASLSAAVEAERKLAQTWRLEKVRLQQEMEDKIVAFQQVAGKTRSRPAASLARMAQVMEAAEAQIVSSRKAFACAPSEIMQAKRSLQDTLDVLDVAIEELSLDNAAFEKAKQSSRETWKALEKERAKAELLGKDVKGLAEVVFGVEEVNKVESTLGKIETKLAFAGKLLRNENLLDVTCWLDVENNAHKASRVLKAAAEMINTAQLKVGRIRATELEENKRAEDTMLRFHSCEATFKALKLHVHSLRPNPTLQKQIEEVSSALLQVEELLEDNALTREVLDDVVIYTVRAEEALEETKKHVEHCEAVEHWRAVTEAEREEVERKESEEHTGVAIQKESALLEARKSSLWGLKEARQLVENARGCRKAVEREFVAAAAEVARAESYFFEDVDPALITESCANALVCAKVLADNVAQVNRNVGSVAEVVRSIGEVEALKERWNAAAVRLTTLRARGIHGYKKPNRTGFHHELAPLMLLAEGRKVDAEEAVTECASPSGFAKAELAVLRFENAVEKGKHTL